jgi:HKD family nuclease
MFLSSKNYLEQFRYLVKNSENLSLAVAFWGKGADTLIEKEWTGKTLRILCNLGSGGTNPKVIRNLLKLRELRPGMQILLQDDLHAKVAVSDVAAIVGSANLSANGLGFEDVECINWQEAGMLVNDIVQVSELQQWFDEQWARGEEVTEERLASDEEQWRKNRCSRLIVTNSFTKTPLAALRDRDIYVAIYRESASVQADDEIIEVRNDVRQLGGQGINADNLDFYEGWSDESEEPLPKNKPIISVRYKKNEFIKVDGAWERVPELDRVFYSDETGEKVELTIVKPMEQIATLSFGESDRKVLKKWFKQWIDELSIGPETDYARCLPFDKFIDWKEGHSSGE